MRAHPARIARPVVPIPDFPFDADEDPSDAFERVFGYRLPDAALQQYGDTQLDALHDLYNALNGVGWVNSTGWSEPGNTSPCGNRTAPLWYGLRCAGTIVVRISLSKNGLGGVLPSSVGNLQYLQYLELTGNSLIGPLPSTLTNLTALTYLDVEANAFTGSFPDLSALSSLQLLYAGSNSFSGALPSLAGCSALQYLMFTLNHFKGQVPAAWAQLPIQLLDVGLNALSGTFPVQLCASSYLMTCSAYGNPQLRCPAQECSKCDLPTCNCDMNACLSPSDCANGLCTSCGGSGPIYFCQ